MWIVWTLLGVLVVYGFYALVASKLIRRMIPKWNICRRCLRSENCNRDRKDPKNPCNWEDEKI